MHDRIDKNEKLFLPEKAQYLLFGGNFLFAKRFYELAKRNFFIKRIDYKDIESFKRLPSLLNYYNVNTLIMSSELLLGLSKKEFDAFIEALSQIQTTDIKIIWFSITDPICVIEQNSSYELKTGGIIPDYRDRRVIVDMHLSEYDDLIYRFSSYYTYVDSNFQLNPIKIIKEEKYVFATDPFMIFVDFADIIIEGVLSNLRKTGTVYHNGKNIATLQQFVQDIQNNDAKYNTVDKQIKCSLNILYRKEPHEEAAEREVAEFRISLGDALAQIVPAEVIEEIDFIVPVPETGKYYAQGLAAATGKQYIEALYKKVDERSFDITDENKRNQFITNKLGVLKSLVEGKTVAIVDEAIFTGTTLKVAVNLLKACSVKNIYIFIPSPKCVKQCGFNMQPKRKLLLENEDVDLNAHFGVKGVFFQNVDTYDSLISRTKYDCSMCFSGNLCE